MTASMSNRSQQDKAEKDREAGALKYWEDKEQKRLEANRIRARDSRKRNKAMKEHMRQKIVFLSKENNELKQRNRMLETEIGRVLREQSMGLGSIQAREVQLRGRMARLDRMQGGMQHPPMGHIDALGHDMPRGAGRQGTVDMADGLPGHQGYGDLRGGAGLMSSGGAFLPAGAGTPSTNRSRQQQLNNAHLMNKQRMA